MIMKRQEYVFHIGLCWSIFAGLGLILMTFAPIGAAQQSQPALQITSPADGTTVSPGQTVIVSVKSPAGVSFAQVAVIGGGPLASDSVATSLPSQFSVVLPTSLAPRKYQLTAVGATPSGQLFSSAPISIDVERSDLPTAITPDQTQLTFQCQGQQTQLRIVGSFSGGSILDVTESSNMSYISANAGVAVVDSNGIVTGIGTGSTSVTVAYRQGTSSLLATVSISVPPPVLSPSPSSLSFGNQAVGTGSSSQPLSVTNVSKNQGLKISGVGTTGDFSETDNCVSPTPLAVGASCMINVTFAPTAAGSRTGAINIANSQAIIPLAVPLTGTGVCHYVSITPSPSSVAVGGTVTITGSVLSCTNSTQTIVVQFILTGPLQSGSCSSTNSVMYTTPPFTLPANTKKMMSFPFTVPKNACPGSYTITATTSVSGIAVDTSSATLTVRAY